MSTLSAFLDCDFLVLKAAGRLMRRQLGFLDVDDCLKWLSDLGDQFDAFKVDVDFEMFRADLASALAYTEDDARSGQLLSDPLFMFKILVIQTINNPSDERTEFLINDWLSFVRFLALGLLGRVPASRTMWLFRERLTKG